jgi:hypothetical protein
VWAGGDFGGGRMKHIFTILALLLFAGCSQAHIIIPIAYYDCDSNTGIFGDVYWFEGELHGGDDLYAGYVSVKKFIEVQDRSSSKIPERYNVQVKKGHYSVMIKDGDGLYILQGMGAGRQGIEVTPSWLPDVRTNAVQIPLVEGIKR